jgi:ATP-dependent phosphoenolpyruvate carboxykinase
MLFITQRKSNSFSILTSSVAELYEYAMLPEHMESPDPTVGPSSITETGALMCSSGSKTGRVPKDKRIVLDGETKDVSI